MSLEDTEEKIEWRKRSFECKQKNSYGIENQDNMMRIHDREVNQISECNILHDIINPSKRAKILNVYYCPNLRGCMNTRKGREKFNNFQTLL